MIKRIDSMEQLPVCLEIIHKSFKTVADKFNFTKENCPRHTSFMPIEKLEEQYKNGFKMFLYSFNDDNIGFFSVKSYDNNLELNTLGVLPEYRENGIGRSIIDFSKKYAREHNCRKIKISIVEENTILRKWYESLGFIHTGIKIIPDLPFTVGFMELTL
ncbi:acetyltransferase YpeA [Clostridiales bacterium]|nr:acetyltransferase YpeA [Clostridiales bacterium]